jgi:beta-lactamase class D
MTNLKTGKQTIYNSERINKNYCPASTFKLLNSLIALETKVIENENKIIKWDGHKHNIASWNKDHNMTTSLRHSVVWFYQELAKKIGKEKMQNWINKCNYGNKNIDGDIDSFWLDGKLRISPKQQMDFLRKLYNEQLPFSKTNQAKLKKMLLVHQQGNFKMFAKTGWSVNNDPQTGWYVGFIENKSEAYAFVLNMDINNKSEANKRSDITYSILNKCELFD